MKAPMKWIAVLAVLAVVGALGLRMVAARKAKLAAVPAVATQSTIELAASDVVRAQERTLAQGLPISGAIKAANSAFVKAKVAGELQGLTVREGDSVRAGQQLAKVDAAEYQARVNQAQRQADAAKAQIDIAQRQYDNNKALVDQGFISRTALDTSLASLEAAQASFKASVAGVDLVRKSLEDTVLLAPISGIVAQRLAQPGERVGIDARVLEIVDLSRLELEASLSSADSLAVRVGQTAALSVEGAPATLAARVVRVNPSAQAGSRSVLVYLSIDKPAGLRQGLFAQGTLGTAATRALALPLSAVRTDKPAPYVQMVEAGKLVHRPVELGARGESGGEPMVAVTGVADQAQVLLGSVGSLREGTVVKFTQAAVAASSAAASK